MQKDSSLNDHATIKEKQPPGQINNNQLNNTIPKPTTFEISVRNPIINESQIKNKLSINKTGERKLLKLTVKYKNRWERIVKEFNGFGIRDLQGILAKTVKRVLNKCNRENDKLFHPSQINQLKTDFVIKIFNTMIRKRKQEYEEGYLDLVDTFINFAFLDNSKRRQRMAESQMKLMKNFLVKVIETSKKEETKLRKIRKDYLNLEQVAVKEFTKVKDEEGSKAETGVCSIDDAFYCSLIRSCIKIEKVCEIILKNKDNRFKQSELDMYSKFLIEKKEKMEQRAKYVLKYGNNEKVYRKLCDTMSLMERCYNRLQVATVRQVVDDINELFMKSDSETKQDLHD